MDEADYERALHLELMAMGIENECQVPLPLIYKGANLDCGYRMDLLVAGRLLLELKAVEKLHPLHEAQLLTYLRLAQMKLGLLMNFGSLVLRDGIVRRANSASRALKPRSAMTAGTPIDALSYEVIDAAIEVQHILGAGLLRSVYETALAHEIKSRGLHVDQRLPANITFRQQLITSTKQIPMVVEGRLMVGIVCAKKLDSIHLARQRSLLKATQVENGLCFNFHAMSMATEAKCFSRQFKR
ncbi:GxxExxY protein [Prosthecobacter sp.]|uniref:GxxExxY protein n=1 Tax=Prosthecobacter sp. TaxID=1965333 RepID=UPI0037847596